MNISDEILMAYADGELDAEQRRQVEQAVKQDAQLARKLEKHRALHQRLHRELDGVLTEAVPDRLLATLKAPATKAQPTSVIDLETRRAAKQVVRRAWTSREWSAMAACLVAGLCLGLFALNFRSGAIVATRDGVMIASGKLATALDTQLASTQSKTDAVQIGLSFRDQSGDYCRSFALQENQVAGLACNSGKDWRVQMLTESERDANGQSSGQYRQAGSEMPAAVLALVEQKISGEALDAEAETAARNSNWKH